MATSLARGLLAGAGTNTVLLTAWCHFLAFALLGAVIGWIAERIVTDAVNGRIAAELEGRPQAAAPPPATPVGAG